MSGRSGNSCADSQPAEVVALRGNPGSRLKENQKPFRLPDAFASENSIHTGSVRLPDRHCPLSLSAHLHRRKYQISPANPLSPTDSQHRAPADGIRSERHFRKRACNSGARLKFTAQQTLLPHARAAFQPDSNSRWTDAFPLSPKVVAMPCLIFGTAERCSHIPYVNYHFSLLLHRDAGGDGKGRLDS